LFFDPWKKHGIKKNKGYEKPFFFEDAREEIRKSHKRYKKNLRDEKQKRYEKNTRDTKEIF
jgi:hypothetical protein